MGLKILVLVLSNNGSKFFNSKTYITVFDKDFCTYDSVEKLRNNLEQINRRNLKGYYHNGYCIESVLFSEKDKLVAFLKQLSELNREAIEEFVSTWINKQVEDIKNISSDLYVSLQLKFKSQKTEARPELASIDFTDYCKEINNDNIQYLMNKGNIKKFIHDFEETFSLQIIEVDEDSSEEFYSSQLFYKYTQVLCNNDML